MPQARRRNTVDAVGLAAQADQTRTPLCPPPPTYLRGAAAQLWPTVVRKLVAEGDWDEHDSELVTAVYCTYAAMLSSAIEQISEHGAVTSAAATGVAQHSPHAKTLRESAEATMKYGDLLNLTPQSRDFRQLRQHEANCKQTRT
jgi:phage terminase small subunit